MFDGENGSAPKTYAREPKLARTERAMYVEVLLPKALWQTPSLRATVSIEDPGVMPVKIDVQAASDALKTAIGLDVDLKIIPQGETE